MGTYNSDPTVFTLAQALTQDANLKGRLWSRMLEVGAGTSDDFSKLEGAAESSSVFWKKKDLKANGGDKVTFSVLGDFAGPGSRGEQELTGRTSKPRLGTYTCQVDFWRDAVEYTKKQLKFLAAGGALEPQTLKGLSRKLGRKRMYDMMHALKRTPNALFLRPNSKISRDTIRATDVLTPSFMVEAKARLQGIGANPIGKAKMKSGADINRFLAFIGQNAMTDIRNSTSYQQSMLQAAERSSDKNPLFSGALPDWNGLLMFEHIVVDPDTNDAIGSPIAPKAILGTAITATTATFILKGDGGTTTLNEYFRDFPGYDYLFTEDQTAAPDAIVYYFWVLNITGGNAGKAGFYSYTGSDNNGNTIAAMQGRLRASASGIAVTTLGQVTWDANTMIDSHPVGSIIIPANAYGVPIAENFIFGAGSALRAYGSIEAEPIKERRDYGFVQGMGYESIFGQRARLDTQGVPRNYVVLQSAYEHPGFPVPSNNS